MRTAPRIPPSGLGPCEANGITPAPSPAFDKSLPGFWYGNSQVALFVELLFYNTVVLDGVLKAYKQQVESSAAALDKASDQLAKVVTFHGSRDTK